MKSPKNYLVILLALTTCGGGLLAWAQYQELIALRAAAMNNDERASWQKKLWDAEKRRHELEAALAALEAKNTQPADVAGEDGAHASQEASAPTRRRGPGGNMARNFMAMMDQPEIQKLLAIQERGALDSRYAALFKNLHLTPEQLDKFKSLLVEKQSAMADVLAAARAQGVDPRSDPQEFRKLVADTQADVDASIKATLGDTGFSEYQQYQQSLPQRNLVNQLEQSLSYTNTPLSPAQSEQLVQLLASASPASANSNRATVTANFGVGFGGNGPTAPVTNAAIQQAQSVLAPSQVQVLQQIQQTQQAQRQLTQAMRNQFNGGTRTTPSTPVKVAPAAPRPGG